MPPFPLFNNHLCCHFLPHPSSWRTAARRCKTPHAAKHSCTSLCPLSLFLSLCCACVVLRCIYSAVCVSVWIPWARSQGPLSSKTATGVCVCAKYASRWVCIFGYALCACVCVWLHTHGYLPECTFWECVCVTVYCMQPCEAVCLLAASRLVFPKQAAGLWLRFVRVCVRACVCTCLIATVCEAVHAKFSLTVVRVFVPVCVILFMNVSLCQPVHLSVCSHLRMCVKWLPVNAGYSVCFTVFAGPGPESGCNWARGGPSGWIKQSSCHLTEKEPSDMKFRSC